MSELRGIIDKYWEKVKEHRFWLHQHPEPSGQEKETSAYVAQVLRDMGLEPTEHVGGYGVTALIQGADLASALGCGRIWMPSSSPRAQGWRVPRSTPAWPIPAATIPTRPCCWGRPMCSTS